MKKCTCCNKKATKQTENGKDNEKNGCLPINDGWYCNKCWEEGVKIEEDAMYG